MHDYRISELCQSQWSLMSWSLEMQQSCAQVWLPSSSSPACLEPALLCWQRTLFQQQPDCERGSAESAMWTTTLWILHPCLWCFLASDTNLLNWDRMESPWLDVFHPEWISFCSTAWNIFTASSGVDTIFWGSRHTSFLAKLYLSGNLSYIFATVEASIVMQCIVMLADHWSSSLSVIFQVMPLLQIQHLHLVVLLELMAE